MESDDSGKEKLGRVDRISLQHQMTRDLAIQEAMKARFASKTVAERLLGYLDKEIETCDRTKYRSALHLWRNKIRNMKR